MSYSNRSLEGNYFHLSIQNYALFHSCFSLFVKLVHILFQIQLHSIKFIFWLKTFTFLKKKNCWAVIQKKKKIIIFQNLLTHAWSSHLQSSQANIHNAHRGGCM